MPQQYIIFFALGAMIFWGIGDFFVQRMSKRMGNLVALTWIYFIGSVVLLPLAIHDFTLIKTSQNLLTLIILSVLECVFGLTLLKAYEKGKLSVMESVLIMELPLTVTMGLIFFREQLSLWQVVLIILVILGVVLTSKKKKNILDKIIGFFTGKNKIWEKGVLIAIIAASISGVYNLMIAVNSRSVSPVMTIWFSWTVSLFFLIGYILLKKKFAEFFSVSKANLKLIFLGSVLDTAAWLFFATALSQKELSITTAITESYPAIAIFLGIRFNQEKISKWQIVGASIALGASITISLIS